MKKIFSPVREIKHDAWAHKEAFHTPRSYCQTFLFSDLALGIAMMLVFLKQFLPSSVAFPDDVRAVMSQYTVYGAATGAALIAAGVAGVGKPFLPTA